MKKLLYTLLAGAMALSSCSKSDEASNLPQSGDQLATFSIEAPAATRATVAGLTRYIVEAYEAGELTTTPVRIEAATGSLTLALKQNTDYTFVFWADFGKANTDIATSGDYYDATSLQDVKVSPAAYATVATPAYCLAVSFNSKDFEANKVVVLKNATAQLNFTEAAGLLTADNSLTVKYSSGGKLNVATGKVTEIGSEISRTYTNIGMIAKDGILASDYILAPLGEKRLLNLKVTFNAEAEKSITAVPFQQSYKTSVKGEFGNFYSSTFTISDQVEDYENNPEVEFPEKAKVGDFYYKDKTFSSTYTADAANPCIGIVFVVNADGKTGKIVSVENEVSGKWCTGAGDIGAISDMDGATNTAKVLAMSDYSETRYPAFAWCATKNTTAPAGINWYMPASNELSQLYAAMCGLKWVASGAGLGEINDWGVSSMPNYANYATAHTAFNGKFTTAQGTPMRLSLNFYWSSTEYGAERARSVGFDNGLLGAGGKINGHGSVRAVSAF